MNVRLIYKCKKYNNNKIIVFAYNYNSIYIVVVLKSKNNIV